MPGAPPIPLRVTPQEIQQAKPILNPDERAAVLAQIQKFYDDLGYNEDEIIKMPLKNLVKMSQVASEATMSALGKYLQNVPEALKAYLVANVLPEDYRNEVALSREVNRLSNELKALRQEVNAVKQIVNDSVPAGNDSE